MWVQHWPGGTDGAPGPHPLGTREQALGAASAPRALAPFPGKHWCLSPLGTQAVLPASPLWTQLPQACGGPASLPKGTGFRPAPNTHGRQAGFQGAAWPGQWGL